MKQSTVLVFAALCASVPFAHAQQTPTVISECPKGSVPAQVAISMVVNSTPDCPLLETKSLRKLLGKSATGAVFAYPVVPGTCISGANLSGSITRLDTQVPMLVSGTVHSAQRLYAEAAAVGDNLSIAGVNLHGPFATGAAMSVVSLTGVSEAFAMQIVTDDRFVVDYSSYPALNTEEFLILDSTGDRTATGRLTGVARIHALPGTPLTNETFNIGGFVCLR